MCFQRENPTVLFPFSFERKCIIYVIPVHPCAALSLIFNVRPPYDSFMLLSPPLNTFVIYTCSTISGTSIFYSGHLFFIRRECCVTQRYCCFASVKVFGENSTSDPLTCTLLAEGLG